MENRTLLLEEDEPTPVEENYESPPPDKKLLYDINFYGSGVVILMGLILNVVALAVFIAGRKLRKATTVSFLMVLVVGDLLYLLGELLRWLNSSNGNEAYLGLDFLGHSVWVCRLTYYIRYSAQIICSWMTLAITTERFVAVAYPTKVKTICTVRTSRVAIGSIVVAAFVLGAFPSWTLGLSSGRCVVKARESYNMWMTSLRIACYLLPALTMVIVSCLISAFLYKARKLRQRMSTHSGTGSRQASMDRQMTGIMLAVASTFVVLRLPYILSYWVAYRKDDIWGDTLDDWVTYRLTAAVKITDVFATANYAISFFLFCLSAGAFRKQLRRMFCGSLDGRRGSRDTSGTIALTSRMTSRSTGVARNGPEATPRRCS